MPNIEIHGVDDGWRTANGYMVKSQPKLLGDIFSIIETKVPELKNEAVVTICNDSCFDRYRKQQPFLRICSSQIDHLEKVVEVLKPLGLDIDTQELENFYPKE